MRITIHNHGCRRRGAIAPLAVFLLVFMVGMVAMCVDIGHMVLAKSNLQNAADAAALAGVQPLMDGYVQYQMALNPSDKTTALNNAMANARTYAKKYAAYHAAGGVNSLTLNDADIEFGFMDAAGNYSALTLANPYPNTIRVTLRRDDQANGTLGLYFAPVFGIKNVSLVVQAAATMYGGTVNSFNSNPVQKVGVLPLTYDVNHWTTFTITGLDPDGGKSTYSGKPSLQVYPSIKAPGNFGQLSLNDNHVGASVEKDWVINGIGASEIQALQNSNLIPLSGHDSSQWDWLGDTGMKQSLVSTINDYAGKTFVLPLFSAYDNGVPFPSDYSAGVGQGSHYSYQIVAFVGIRIAPGDHSVIVQPAAMVSPDLVFTGGSPVPIGTGSATGLVTTFATPKLTQ